MLITKIAQSLHAGLLSPETATLMLEALGTIGMAQQLATQICLYSTPDQMAAFPSRLKAALIAHTQNTLPPHEG